MLDQWVRLQASSVIGGYLAIFFGVATVATLVLGWKRCWFRLLALVLVVPGGMVLNVLLKITFHRQRPSFAESFLVFNGFSFPSGHTMAAKLLVYAFADCPGRCVRSDSE
jgi:membrane-associated phospholipid phosphatase